MLRASRDDLGLLLSEQPPSNTYKAPGSQWAHISAKVVVVPSLSPLFVLSVL